MHDTPLKACSTFPFGVGTIDQAAPLQDSARGWLVSEELSKKPTAMQLVGPEHDTPPPRLLSRGPWFGLEVTDQDVPSHDSTSVLMAVVNVLPTDTQLKDRCRTPH